ncbi:MAG TPA: hypothetical protein VG897_08060 [Terriglobales bacterium]|nr:hypothetical protein [Terriglobales bacterium]
MSLSTQVVWLFVLAIPVASVAWTVTHEEVFREVRDYFVRCSKECRYAVQRKFFYLFTCEYCFSHYVAAIFLVLTRFKLLYLDWRGYIIALFGLVWVANLYMSIYAFLRVDLKVGRFEAAKIEHEVKKKTEPRQQIEKPAA